VTDEQLIADVRTGSRDAFEALFERYRQPVWEFFRRRTLDATRAEELAQDTFVALMEGASRYEARSAFRSYLFGIAYNVLHADRRKGGLRRTETLPFDAISPHVDPDAGLWVRHALERLDEDEREILMLREYEELSYQEIADLRRLPLNTVRSKLFRARMALKAALAPDHPRLRTER
jgi:RNA polymerase sigma-70 factor (ECF subfamily)